VNIPHLAPLRFRARRSPWARLVGATLSLALVGAACSSDREDDAYDVHDGPDANAGDARDDDARDTDASIDTTPDVPVVHPVLLDIPEGCNPVAFEHDCLFPFPSDVFLVEDAARTSGRRVHVGGAAMIMHPTAGPIDPVAQFPADGFSVHPPIMIRHVDGFSTEGLIFHTDDVYATLTPESRTILLNADTGEPVLHFAELDLEPRETEDQLLVIRPLVRLEHDTRYVVAFRDVNDASGAPLAPFSGFTHIAGGVPTLNDEVNLLAARYEDEIFGPLESFGVARDALQLAWDFTTRSERDATGDMRDMRDDALARLHTAPPAVTIRSVREGDDIPAEIRDSVWRLIVGSIEVPHYLDAEGTGARIARDAEGRPSYQGQTDADFTLYIPHSVADGTFNAPVRVVQYGHGFFGGRDEILGTHETSLANELVAVFAAVDWWGMMTIDGSNVGATIVADPESVFVFGDRVHQAMVNQMAFTIALRDVIPELDALLIDDQQIYALGTVPYLIGQSQGHILGAVLFALSPDFERAVLGVGGASFTFMMSRARPFGPFLGFLNLALQDALAIRKFVALAATATDRFDPITYAPYIFDAPLAGAPEQRRVLMQYGIGDAAVPPIAHELHARVLGVGQLEPFARAVPGLTPVRAPWDGSAVTQFDTGLEPVDTFSRIPDRDNTVHTSVRRSYGARAQIDAFLRPAGRIEHFCEGPCDLAP